MNHNWPSHWDQRGGASTSPCEQDYKGPSAGDGVEIKALEAHLDSIAAGKGVTLYMDIHSYSQFCMYPHGVGVPDVRNECETYADFVHQHLVYLLGRRPQLSQISIFNQRRYCSRQSCARHYIHWGPYLQYDLPG
jgi:hypothetical protein